MREKQNKIEFFSPGKEVGWQISKLRTVSFQFISKGASLARNKDALIVGANTEWADSRDGKWAVIMSICLLQFPPHPFVSLYISSSFFPSISSCLILLYHSVILLYIFFTSTFLCFHLFKKKKFYISCCPYPFLHSYYPSIFLVFLALIISFLFVSSNLHAPLLPPPTSPPALISSLKLDKEQRGHWSLLATLNELNTHTHT